MKVAQDKHKDIINAYTIDLLSMQEIANLLHVSRAAIHTILRKHGIDTSKQRIAVTCTACGTTVYRTRKQVRRQHNHFCNRTCYDSYLTAGKASYAQDRHSQRLARAVVTQYFDLQPRHIVHHEDGNSFNNKPDNLRVFSNQGDHIRYHHYNRDRYHNELTKHVKRLTAPIFNEIQVIWDGRSVDIFKMS